MVKVFVNCLLKLGIKKHDLKISIRLYEDLSRERAVDFWARTIGVHKDQIAHINILPGRKKGKLEYGMCRIRVKKASFYFKIIQSIIELIKAKYG